MASETRTPGSDEPVAPDGVEQRARESDGESVLLDADSDEQPVVTVVMPTLNEQEGIVECIDRIETALRQLGTTGEIIVSDSSTDRTPDLAREHGAIVVEPDKPGYGYAYRFAFRHARGEYVAIGDADTTYDFTQLPELIAPVADGSADMVMGSRLEGEIESGAMPPLHQHVGNPLLTKFLNVFYDTDVSDAHSGFRVLSRDALGRLDLDSDGMEFASEMVMKASVAGLEIEEVPITYSRRRGSATLDSFQDGWRHVRFMLKNAPRYLFFLPAAVFLAAGVAMLALSVTGTVLGGVVFGVQTAIAGSLLTIVGTQVGCVGVFSAVAGDPIRRPESRLLGWIRDDFRLEHGFFLGLGLVGAGGAYLLAAAGRWAASGGSWLPLVTWNMVAFTGIVIGIQLVFYSFYYGIIHDGA